MRQSAFWDTSALVPLCVQQSVTPSVIARYKIHNVIVWWATPVEIASDLARLARMRHLRAADYAKARKLAAALADSWSVIQPSAALRALAIRIVDQYDLRAADSLQLAAGLEWCGGVPNGRVFTTADERIREAALLAGFDARPL